ncbi:hypothetical protein HYV49_01040 [Candidatus Pacearchaeota archaeon]|nr:hypothetical protein [Candidatus Pacearchaeota archaeon]
MLRNLYFLLTDDPRGICCDDDDGVGATRQELREIRRIEKEKNFNELANKADLNINILSHK